MKKANQTNKIVLGCVCAALTEGLYGISYLFTKQITEIIDPFDLLGWRFLFAFAFMQVLVMVGVLKVNFKGRKIVSLLKIATFHPVLYYIAETFGIKYTTASESGAFISCVPVVTLLVSALLLKKKPTKAQTCGILVTLFGVLICMAAAGIRMSFSVAGYLWLTIAVFSFSLYSVFAEKAEDFNSVEKTYIMLLSGVLVFAPAALIRHLCKGTARELLTLLFTSGTTITAFLYLGIVCSVLAMMLYNTAIQNIGNNRAASFVGVTTVVSVLSGTLVLHESMSLLQAIGIVLIIGGVYVANQRSLSTATEKE